MSVIPPVFGKAQMIRQKLLGLQTKANLTENALPITQGTTYLRSYGKNDMSKTYYIPKSQYDIDIETEASIDYAKISYTVNLEGKYQIYITSRGQNIVGSPFTMTATNNVIDIFEKDNEWLENGEEIDIVDVSTDRKVVLRIVDFVTEKMLLKENGVLEKISDEDANVLMSTDELNDRINKVIKIKSNKLKSNGFKETARKIVQMNRVCNIIKSLVDQKPKKAKKKYSLEQLIQLDAAFSRPRSQQDVPDIVNSTLSEMKVNPFVTEKQDKFIVPQNITVSLCTEKAMPVFEDNIRKSSTELNNSPFTLRILNDTSDSLNNYSAYQDQTEHNDFTETIRTFSNPFLTEIYVQDYAIEKELGSFVKTEYETNNSQHEETEDGPIRIIVDEQKSETPSPINNMNPFSEPDVIVERPKTPVLKIITGEVKNRDDSVYVDPETERLTEEILANEFINPFFLHGHQSQKQEHLPITDFIIGAPVSLPPLIRATTPEPHMESLLITSQENTEVFVKDCDTKQESVDEESESVFSTPLHTIKVKINEFNKGDNHSSSISSTFHSLDANTANIDSTEIISLPNISEYQEGFDIDRRLPRDITHKKDIWDSAYVSIDDNNSSPDSNNNDNQLSEVTCKQRFTLSDDNFETSNMGPAEREIWQSCRELQDSSPKQCEEVKINRWEVKRPTFTPILEESDRSISTGLKEITRTDTIQEVDTMIVAFPEHRDVYETYLTNSDCSSTACKEIKTSNKFVTDMTKRYEASVDSASESTDVKRHAKELEGKISEVQANVTESVSVSQTLQIYENEQPSHQVLFGDSNKSNIVLEKKQYWDKKIQEIEAISLEENKCQQKRRRLSARHLRNNDSLTKRRGKQIVKNFLNASDQQTTTIDKEIPIKSNPDSQIPLDEPKPDVKLVEKWKKFWDNKLDTEKEEVESTCFRAKSPKSKEMPVSPQAKYKTEDVIETYKEQYESNIPSPIKQELPEEVFKAFETSPKRFFGTSRKQILNKIDTFLGKPSTADESSTEFSGAAHHDIGLVSSRISLFHNISQTDEISCTERKCQSMQNILQRKDSKINNISEENTFVNEEKSIDENNFKRLEITSSNTINTTENNTFNVSLENKRSRISNKINNFEQTTNQDHKPTQELAVETQTSYVNKAISQNNGHSKVLRKSNPVAILKKSSFSKSEMDIFKKFEPKHEEDDFEKYKSCDELPRVNVKNVITLYESVSKIDINQPVRKLSLRKLNSTSSGS